MVTKLGILVTVADQVGSIALHVSRRGHELRFGTGFQPVGELFAGTHHMIQDLTLLIDLDGIDSVVAAAIALLGDGLSERFVQPPNAGFDQFTKMQDHRRLDELPAKLPHDPRK